MPGQQQKRGVGTVTRLWPWGRAREVLFHKEKSYFCSCSLPVKQAAMPRVTLRGTM